MARPYSMDLRERVVQAVEQEGLSRRQAAERFGIGIKTAIDCVCRFRATGSMAAKPMGGCRPKKIVGEYRDWLLERCRGQDFTLRGLVGELAERGLQVDYRTVRDFVHGEKLTYKKDAGCQRARPAGCSPPTPAVDGLSGAHRPCAPGSSSTKPGPKPTWCRFAGGHPADNGCQARRHTATGRP
jgi:putative transposase